MTDFQDHLREVDLNEDKILEEEISEGVLLKKEMGETLVVPGDGLALFGMPDIELLIILRITCDITGKPHESGKFD